LWLFATVATGTYWLVDRGWHATHRKEIEGVKTLPPEVIKLRKAHIPFRTLRRLGAHNEVYDLEVTHHEIAIPDLPEPFDGYRIAFMTDTHVASFMRRSFYRECVEQINRRDVDLVLLGGDFVSWKRHIPLMAKLLLDGLESRDGIYAVLGNHDYWSDPDAIIAAMMPKGVEFLTNRSVQLRRGGSTIDLLGIDEIYRGDPKVDRAFSGVPGDRPCIGVSHHPDIVNEIGDRRIDLLLAGHTHGGQIRFPFLGAVVVPSKHEGLYDSGFHRQKRVLLYVSRGLGAVPPIRILCKPELATFTLRRDGETEGRRDGETEEA
ncbi:MAG: metallophosphoesterase, partial [Thermoanaerobaculia bacterium]|nr:metallophosphoesterase [Thermoanaerobaculia bacterium]